MPTDLAAPVPPYGSARPPSRNGLRIAGVVGVCLAAFVVVTGVLKRTHEYSTAKSLTTAEAIPTVGVVHPTQMDRNQKIVLPGELQAYYNAQIFSRVSGYVHMWYKDIGAKVKAGEILAIIDTPELDQQLEQARADLASAQANMRFAASTAQRWNSLLAKDAVSKQEAEEKNSDFEVRSALVNAAKANLNRLQAMKAFARITAPFDGVVTARRTDIGALVNAGAGASPTAELFDVAKVDQLRLYVRVPQNDSALIGPATTATLTAPEHPGVVFPATFTSTANAVSSNSGTLLVQLAVKNADGQLKAGDYAQVSFDLPRNTTQADARTAPRQVQLPSSTLLFRHDGMDVAVVGADSRARLVHVAVLKDLGPTVTVSGPLTEQDAIINNPPDSITNGQLVRIDASLTTSSGKASHVG